MNNLSFKHVPNFLNNTLMDERKDVEDFPPKT